MKRKIAIYLAVVLSETQGELPKEFLVFPKGKIDTSKGTFLFDEAAAESVMAAYAEQGNELHFDYNHQSVLEVGDSPAAGWFNLEVRNGELWATNIRWTSNATKRLSDKEYRYFSPTFFADDDNRILELVSIALTNTPATKNQQPLVAATIEAPTTRKDMDEEILKLLGLSPGASAEDVKAAIRKLNAALKGVTVLTGKKTHEEAADVLIAWKVQSEKYEALAKEQKLTRQIDDAVANKKLEPAKRAFALELGLVSEDLMVKYLDNNVPAVNTSGGSDKAEKRTHKMSKERRGRFAKLGLSDREVEEIEAEEAGEQE